MLGDEDIRKYIEFAYKLARDALKKDEVPVGCVIVKKDGIVGFGHNLTNARKSPLQHAEIVALKMMHQKNNENFNSSNELIHKEPLHSLHLRNFENQQNLGPKYYKNRQIRRFTEQLTNSEELNKTISLDNNLLDFFSLEDYSKSSTSSTILHNQAIESEESLEIKSPKVQKNESHANHHNHSINHSYRSSYHTSKKGTLSTENKLEFKEFDGSKQVDNDKLYVFLTLEPCGMCLGILKKFNCIIYYTCKNYIFGGFTVFEMECENVYIDENDRSVGLMKEFYKHENQNAPEEKRKCKEGR